MEKMNELERVSSVWEADTGCQTTTRRSQLLCAITNIWHSPACQYLLRQLTVSPPRTVGLISSYASGEGCSLKLNGEQFSVNYKYYLKVFGLRFKMTAARDEETICVSHVLSLSKCQFDIIANQLSHTKSATGLLLSTRLGLLLIRLAGDSDI